MIREKVDVLVVEDNPNDAILIDYHVRKLVAEPNIFTVSTFDQFVEAIELNTPDIILSDYRLNDFTGMEVLKYTTENTDIADFIFITGTIYDEELAAQTILSGATGYILKKHINNLHTKLLPHFEKMLERRHSALPNQYETMLANIKNFVEASSKENKLHVASYNQIRDAIEQIEKNK